MDITIDARYEAFETNLGLKMRAISKFVSFAIRRTSWSEGQIFTIAPEQIEIVQGIRAAVGIATPLGASLYFGIPDFAFSAVAVFWTCLCDPTGPDKLRLETMSRFALLGCVVITLASYGSHLGPFVGGATLFVLVLACGLTRSFKAAFGPTPAQGGLIAAVAVVVGVSSPRDVVGSLELGGFFLIGAIWTIVLSLYIWPTRSLASGGQALVAIFSRLEEMLRSLEELDALAATDENQWKRFDTVYRRAARISIERGRAIVARMFPSSSRYSRAIDVAGRTFAAIIAIGHHRRGSSTAFDQRSEQPLITGLRKVLQLVVQQADEPRRDTEVLLTEVKSLIQISGDGDNLVARAVSFAARALRELVVRWEEPERDQGLVPVTETVPYLNFQAAVWRHSLRVSIAVLVCYVVGVWFNVTFSYWGSIAALVVMQPLMGNTWLRVLERAVGSVIGGIAAALLISQLSGNAEMAFAIVLLSVAVIALRLVNYATFVIFLTPMFMLLSDYIRPADGLILARVVNEGLGACVGLAASLLLWPDKEVDGLAGLIIGAIKSNMAFACAVLRHRNEPNADLDKLQREAGIQSGRVETTRERLWLGGRYRSARLDSVGEVTVALRSICGAAAVLEISGPSEADEERIEYYEAVSANLQSKLGSLTNDPSPTLPVLEKNGDLDHAVQALVCAVDSYVMNMKPSAS